LRCKFFEANGFISYILALILGPIFIGAQVLTQNESYPLLSTKAYSDTASSWTYLNGYLD